VWFHERWKISLQGPRHASKRPRIPRHARKQKKNTTHGQIYVGSYKIRYVRILGALGLGLGIGNVRLEHSTANTGEIESIRIGARLSRRMLLMVLCGARTAAAVGSSDGAHDGSVMREIIDLVVSPLNRIEVVLHSWADVGLELWRGRRSGGDRRPSGGMNAERGGAIGSLRLARQVGVERYKLWMSDVGLGSWRYVMGLGVSSGGDATSRLGIVHGCSLEFPRRTDRIHNYSFPRPYRHDLGRWRRLMKKAY